MPGGTLCPAAAVWLVKNRRRRILWVIDGADVVSAGFGLLASDAAYVAPAITEALGDEAEAATFPDRTICVIVAPAGRLDRWAQIVGWCGLQPRLRR